jgi:hypothetical protein
MVRTDEKLTAFLELERVTRESFRFQMPNNSAQLPRLQLFERLSLESARNGPQDAV